MRFILLLVVGLLFIWVSESGALSPDLVDRDEQLWIGRICGEAYFSGPGRSKQMNRESYDALDAKAKGAFYMAAKAVVSEIEEPDLKNEYQSIKKGDRFWTVTEGTTVRMCEVVAGPTYRSYSSTFDNGRSYEYIVKLIATKDESEKFVSRYTEALKFRIKD